MAQYFNLMIKPAGASCNLSCKYCYYADKAGRYSTIMSGALLERCLREYLETTDLPQPCVCWHGGEPLLAGIDFYRRALDIESRYCDGKTVLNTIQTNGTLINRNWSHFFADNGFLVGISIDGPQDIHDRNRLNHNGDGSFNAVMSALDSLKEAGADYNTLSVVHNASEGRGAEIYRFLRDEAGSKYMQFIPVEGHPLNAKGYGQFLCEIFDCWAHGDIGKIFVQNFDATLARWCNCTPALCSMSEYCGENLSVECNGDVYACDHVTDFGHRLGNIATESLSSLYNDNCRLRFLKDKTQNLSVECRNCQWLQLCYGGCPAQRTSEGQSRLCDGLKTYFAYTAAAMQRMKAAIMG